MTKTLNAERSGAVAVMIADNDPTSDNYIDMITDNASIVVNIPAVFITWKDGQAASLFLLSHKFPFGE